MLLELAKEIGCTRFLFSSSMSVYGDQPHEPIGESSTCNPISFYGVGKLASEHYLNIYSGYGIDSTVLRLFNVYGPGQNMENLRQGMVSIYLAQAIRNKKIEVKGSPDRFRDFVFIDDVIDAFIRLEHSNNSFGSTYNIASGTKTRVRKLLSKLCEILCFEGLIEYSDGTPGDQHGIYADISRIKNDIEWEPRVNLDQGLSLMARWASETVID